MQLYYYTKSIKDAIKNVNNAEEMDNTNEMKKKRFKIVRQYLVMNSTFKSYIY